MGKRRSARELSLQILYQLEITHESSGNIQQITHMITPEKVSSEVKDYARTIATGTIAHQAEIDALIERYADHWELDRISIIDKNIMRQAIFEMLFAPEQLPPSVCINEAIEISKKFSSSLSPAFINGILDKIKPIEHAGELT
ncbi:transcription antitermination factor NusB [bacterium]|nr:transcription antitermination factor NusB [bacterium]